MFVNYALYQEDAEVLHKKYDVTPILEIYVGVLGHKLYSSFVKSVSVMRVFARKTARPYYAVYSNLADQNIVSDIFLNYLHKMTGVKCEIQYLMLKDKTYLYPVYNGNYLYFHDKECFLMHDLRNFSGRALLSSCPSVLEFCEKQPFFPDVKENEGVYTFDSEIFGMVGAKTMLNRQSMLEEYVAVSEEYGTYSVESDKCDAHIAIELANIWNIPKTITEGRLFLHRKKEDTGRLFEASNIGLPFASWITESMERISLGKTPLVRFFVRMQRPEIKEQMISHNPLLERVAADFKTVQYATGFLIQVPVFDLDDYRLAEKIQYGMKHDIGDKVIVSEVSSSKLVESVGDGKWTVITDQDREYEVESNKSQEEVKTEWSKGSFFSPWGSYCLSVYNFESVALIG